MRSIEEPAVATVIVTYNGMPWIGACLESLATSTSRTQVIVVDNGSTDETVSFITRHFNDTIILSCGVNHGFGQANNLGIRHCLDNGFSHIFLLNQDTRVEPDTIRRLLEAFMLQAGCGIVSPLHFNGRGLDLDLYFRRYLENAGFEFHRPFTVNQPVLGPRFLESPFVNAAAWLVSAQCIEAVGGFDPVFFHYGEDLNFALRARYRGFRLMVDCQAVVYHDREDRIRKHDEPSSLDLKKLWDQFMNQACDPGKQGFLNFSIRRACRHVLESVRCLFDSRSGDAFIHFHMAVRIIVSLRSINRARQRMKSNAFTLPTWPSNTRRD